MILSYVIYDKKGDRKIKLLGRQEGAWQRRFLACLSDNGQPKSMKYLMHFRYEVTTTMTKKKFKFETKQPSNNRKDKGRTKSDIIIS